MPLNKRISEENLLRYNGMLIGVFDLLADARSQMTSATSYIETLRDFWIAQRDLQMSLIGKPSLKPPHEPASPLPAGRITEPRTVYMTSRREFFKNGAWPAARSPPLR